MANQQKKSTFYEAAALLAVTTIIVKVIGFIYKYPLMAILPDRAYADYNQAYTIYTLFLTFSTAGLPVALSKTVSECKTLGRENQKDRVFRVAFCTFLVMGIVSFLCLSVFGQFVAANLLHNEKAVFAVVALSPSVLCACCCSAFRGYAQGHMNMVPTGVSQVIEALSKMVLGLILATVIHYSAIEPPELRERLTAAGALVGVSIGSVLSVVYLIWNHIRTRQRRKVRPTDRPSSNGEIFAHLMKLAIPITLSSCTLAIVNTIDAGLVNDRLETVFVAIQEGLPEVTNSVMDIFPRAVSIFQANVTALAEEGASSGIDPILDSVRSLAGAHQKTVSIYNLPANFMVPLTACIVPAVSACITRRDKLGAHQTTESAMRVAALIFLPCGIGLFALGEPIIRLVTFGNVAADLAGPLLSISGIASIFICIQAVASAVLQANGIINLPIVTMVIGGVVKIFMSYFLVGNPKVMIFGAPLGTLACFAVASLLNLGIIKRMVPRPPRYGMVFGKPMTASIIMGGAAWAVHGLLSQFLKGSFLLESIATAGAIFAAMVVYVILVVALRVLSKEDLELMPKGDKIAKILHIR